MEKSEKLLKELKKLSNTEYIEGTAIAARSGLIIVSDMPESVDERRFAAMSATLMASAETISVVLDKGVVKNIFAETDFSKFIATGAGSKAILVALAAKDANIDALIPALEQSAKSIRTIIEG